MAINPFIDLFGSGAAGTSGAAAAEAAASGVPAAAGGAAGIAGMPWSIVIPIAMSLIGEIFGKKDDPLSDAMDLKKQMEMLGIKEPYRSPYQGSADSTMYQALLNQLQRTSNWGWPEGQGVDTSFIQQALDQNFPGTTPGGMRTIRRS